MSIEQTASVIERYWGGHDGEAVAEARIWFMLSSFLQQVGGTDRGRAAWPFPSGE